MAKQTETAQAEISEHKIEIVDTRKKAKCWTCTLNNPDMTDEQFDEYLKSIEQIQYFVFQRERGEENNTEHFQFYIVFETAKHFTTVKKYFPRAHLEISKGTKAENRAYCTKPETRVGEVYEHGTLVEERQRTDLLNILAMINSGATLREIRYFYPTQFFMFQKKLEAERANYLDEKFGDVFRNMNVSYVYGKTGTGKTKTITQKFGYRNCFRVTEYDQRAFDHYDGQDIIIFEEFRGQFKISQMLNYLDGHPVRLPCRFADKTACYSQVFITTNIPLSKQYTNVKEHEPATWDAFERRVTNIYNYDDPQDRQKLVDGEASPRESHLEMLNLTEREKNAMPF